jgi:predicted dehydrogenase
MAFRTLIIGTGFGTRVVQGCYEEAGMTVDVVSPRDADAVQRACAEPYDLVSVHSPPFLHARDVNWALDHRRNVLCDKPFGVSGDEARQMLNRARELGVIHLLNFEFRQDPGRKRVKAIIDSGAIGRVTHIHWTFFNAFSRIPLRKHGWQFDRTRGGGWIRINSTHMIDALRWLVGEIVEVDARARIDVRQRPDKDGMMHLSTAEDGFSAFMTLDTGASVAIDTAWGVPGTLPDHWIVIGTEGMIDVTERIQLWVTPMIRDTEIKLLSSGKEEVEHVGPFHGDAHLPAMRPFSVMVREAIEQHRQIEPSFAAGVAASEVVDKLHASIDGRGGG